MFCKYCKSVCIKRGKCNETQRYQCKQCGKSFLEKYIKPVIPKEKYHLTIKLNNEGCSISSIGRLLKISKSSVQRLIDRISSTIEEPEINEKHQSYEVDELRTFCGAKSKELWLIYAINKKTRQVMDFVVGRRTKENISKVLSTLMSLSPKHIYTDQLNIYKSIISKPIHKIYPRCTNYIERKNLTPAYPFKTSFPQKYLLYKKRRYAEKLCSVILLYKSCSMLF